MSASKPMSLDVYAPPYIPQAFKIINTLPVRFLYSAGVRWNDYASYVRTFAGSSFLAADPNLHPLPPSSDSPQPQILDARDYHHFWRRVLALELQALHRECEEQALYNAPLFPAQRDGRLNMFWLGVPGLREMSLHIELGDTVYLRQMHFGPAGEVLHAPLSTYHVGWMEPYLNPQYNAMVWGIDRRTEQLYLRVDGLEPGSMRFNASFTVQAERVSALHKAVIDMDQALHTGQQPRWTQSMLFPEAIDGKMQTTLNKGTINWSPIDTKLNYEQIRAVDNVLSSNYGAVPYVISGPPGTGKTKTLVELALQLVSSKPNVHLLVCAPSDPAADTLTERLRQHLPPAELLRLNSPSRSFLELPDSILPFCFVDDDTFALPAFREMMAFRIVVLTCRDADILNRACLGNADLFKLERGLLSAFHHGADTAAPALHWTGLLMDEAAQASEPEACIPLSVVAPPRDYSLPASALPIFVLAGDQNQLGPRTASRGKVLQTSLFERLLSRPLYADHPLARSRQSGGVMRPLTQKMLPIRRPPFANLIRNYRSHPAILATPSALFYQDTLEPEAASTDSLLSWNGWAGEKWPVLFVSHAGRDEIEQDGGGWYNNDEARLACQYAQSLLQAGLVEQSEICIMSPFRAQVNVLRKLAREQRMRDVNIGPLEAFQGLESKLVILCTTRTRDRFIEQDLARGLGVIHEPKRFNVALTRAKEGLIVIGNPLVLGKDPNWGAFLAFCRRNTLWEGDMDARVELLDGERAVVSRLERQLLYPPLDNRINGTLSNGVRALGLADDDEHVLWQSGVEFEHALRKIDEDDDEQQEGSEEGEIAEHEAHSDQWSLDET
ncbi:hypothetical protein LTR17_019145 [Elasticomyces elasticus]|nr:hypothetical protein LTR17_019145 [Elasticomyces elasticus]